MTQTSDYRARFEGLARLYGEAGLERLRNAHVCIIGIGGVGSWSVEALARSGIGTLTLIDLDEVCVSNVNRQLPALTATIGRSKAGVMRQRIAEINPECVVHVHETFFTSSNAEDLLAPPYDCVLDAIDSVSHKCELIARCRSAGKSIVTVGGAGGKIDPTAIRGADLALVSHDRLLLQVRRTLRRDYGFPPGSAPFGIPSVFSPESPIRPELCDPGETLRLNCNNGFGSAAFVTGAFGLAASAAVVKHLTEPAPSGEYRGS